MNRSTQPVGVRHVAALFLAAALGLGGGLSVTRTAMDRPDITFVTKAAVAGMLEVRASQAAITHVGNPDIRAFTQRMVKGRTTVGDELKTPAGEKGIAVPRNLPADERAKVDKLGALEGTKFGKACTNEMGVKAHKETASLFNKASESAKDPDIKAFFAHDLPTLREHLQMVEQLGTAAK